MEIVVLVKKVPDPNLPESFVGVSAGGDAIELHASSQSTINPYDLNAVEAAVALKEQHGGRVTVITADDASAEAYLRRAVAIGADRALRVDLALAARDNAASTAEALASALREVGAIDLILAGRSASDTDAGFVPYLVAQKLGMPALGPIISIEYAQNSVIAGKLSDASIDRYRLPLPAMLLISNEINKPRTPSIKGVMASKKAAIELLGNGDQPSADPVRYAPKAARSLANTTVMKDESDEQKAAALLAALGY